MKDEAVREAVLNFSKTSETKYEKTFSVSGNADDVFTVTIIREKRKLILDSSVILESRANTISALPSGSPCGCCNGSGKSS